MKKVFLYPLKILDGLLDRVLAVGGAIIMVQFPQFFAQYLQRLGGHLDEARRVVSEYTKAAASNNMTLQNFIDVHLTSGQKIFVSSGKLMQGFVERLAHLEDASKALREATPWNRWLVFLREMDPAIARQTWGQFTPGIPTTVEAFVYAMIGVIIVWSLYQGVKALILLPFRKIVSPKPPISKPGIPV